MGKKKKSKSSKKGKICEDLPVLYKGQGSFTFPNGDIYEGEYCAHRSGILWREGLGTYTTKDGQTYTGDWKGDKLIEQTEVFIKYPNGTEFCGNLFKSKYNGPGTYKFENNLKLNCDFQDNQPKGEIVLIDYSDHIWTGQSGKDSVVLLQENIFYTNLCEDKGIGDIITKPKFEILRFPKKIKERKESRTEANIFTKSTKTMDDIDFNKSKWYQNYLKFKSIKKEISKKRENGDTLDPREKSWWERYEKYKQNKMTKPGDKSEAVPFNYLETIHSEAYKKSSPAKKVFYPSVDWNEFYKPIRGRKKENREDLFDSDMSEKEVEKLLERHEMNVKLSIGVNTNE